MWMAYAPIPHAPSEATSSTGHHGSLDLELQQPQADFLGDDMQVG